MNEPVFIVGCDRSGTTLLSLILSQSPDLHVTLESGFIPDLYGNRKEYGDFADAKDRWYFLRDLQMTQATSKTIAFDIFEMSDDEAENILSNSAPCSYESAINALFTKTADLHGKPRWGNKTPKYVLHLPLIYELFPDAKIIHVIRDPRDVVASILKAGWTSTVKETARYWEERVRTGIREGRKLGGDRYYELKYELLLQNPGDVTRQICDWLSIGFDIDFIQDYKQDDNRSSIVEHHELFDLIGKPVDPSRAYAWKKHMGKADVAEIEQVTGDLIETLGYEITGNSVPVGRKFYRWTFDTMLETGQKLGKSIGKKL